jgi:hypothetical protein
VLKIVGKEEEANVAAWVCCCCCCCCCCCKETHLKSGAEAMSLSSRSELKAATSEAHSLLVQELTSVCII